MVIGLRTGPLVRQSEIALIHIKSGCAPGVLGVGIFEEGYISNILSNGISDFAHRLTPNGSPLGAQAYPDK